MAEGIRALAAWAAAAQNVDPVTFSVLCVLLVVSLWTVGLFTRRVSCRTSVEPTAPDPLAKARTRQCDAAPLLSEPGPAGSPAPELDIGQYLSRIGGAASSTSPNPEHKVAVLGGGVFGTALAYAAARNGFQVTMYVRDPEVAEGINTQHHNPKYLSQYRLPDNLRATTSVAAAVEGVVLIVHALPCQATPAFFRQHRDVIPKDVLICNTAKGLYVPTQQLIGCAIRDALAPEDVGGFTSSLPRTNPLAFFSGPSFAEEIMRDFPTACVAASSTLFHATLVQKIFSNEKNFRVYVSQDVVGVQLGGALKNPLAVGAGLIAGMGFGTNTLSAMVTRAGAELRQLCIALGGEEATINGLAGIGDLMLTCFSSQSRNQRCGSRLAKGESVESILKDFTVEGVPTASVAVAYADACGLECPLFRAVDAVISGRSSAEEAVGELMRRPAGRE